MIQCSVRLGEDGPSHLISLPPEDDVFIHHGLGLRSEGKIAVRHLEYEDSQGPPSDG